ncbi:MULTISPECIES: hypothetical protein [Carnobacterium]|uniref:hypothetical protein n=1 Tax=Carnobacterium TaxID=2747 RepID=UPI000559481D|nr:hypothetical protein [Carnobacterium maltaromaticum]MCI1820257.1 hypothetical protein [Carnobacterium maltaromaticum]
MNDALEFLLKSIAEQLSLSSGDKGVLLQNLDQYLPELYKYSVSIMDIVVKPIGYTLLGFFLLIEFQALAQKMSSSSNGQTGGMEFLLPLVIKVGFCSLVMRNLALFLKAIMDVGITITRGISNLGIAAGGSNKIDISNAMDTISDLGFFSQLMLLVVFLLVLLISIFTNVLVKVIVFMRFLELYVYMSISPLPVATLPNAELNQIGKNFFKSFVAASLQGTLLFLVLSFYPILVNGIFTLTGGEGAFEITASILGYSVALAFCLFYTGKWSKSITTAA